MKHHVSNVNYFLAHHRAAVSAQAASGGLFFFFFHYTVSMETYNWPTFTAKGGCCPLAEHALNKAIFSQRAE